MCPWVAAEGQENLVTWDSRGWDKSGNPAKHPLPRHIDALKSSSSLQYTQIHTPTHVHVLVLAPFLLANDTMVTEQPASPCASWPSLVSKSKITAGATLGRWGWQGGLRWAAGGGVDGTWGGWQGGEENWKEKKKGWEGSKEKASDIYVLGQQKMPLQPGISLSSMLISAVSLSDLSFAQWTQLPTCCHTSLVTSLGLILLTLLCIEHPPIPIFIGRYRVTSAFHPDISSFPCCHFHITDPHLYATSGPSFVSSPLWFFTSESSFTSSLFPPILVFAYFFSYFFPPPWLIPHPSSHTFSVPCLGSSQWWDSYSLPDEVIANGFWIMHGSQDLESPVY